MDKKYRPTELWKMAGAQLVGLARRMQRIGEQQQSVRQFRMLRNQHRGLAAPVGVSAGKYSSGSFWLKQLDCPANSLPVTLRHSRKRRTKRTRLSKRQIATQYGEAGFCKRRREIHQKIRLTIRPCAMRQQKRISIRHSRSMQESAHRRL